MHVYHYSLFESGTKTGLLTVGKDIQLLHI